MKILTNLTASSDALFKGDVSFEKSVTLGDSSADIITATGQLTASNGLKVEGGLEVNGTLSYINTTNVNVTDKKITIANGAANVTSDAAGVYVGSDTSPIASIYAQGSSPVWHISGSGGVKIAATGSNFNNYTLSGNEIDLEAALRAIDAVANDNTALQADITSSFTSKVQHTGSLNLLTASYNSLRYLVTGNFDGSGNAVVTLPGTKFADTQKDFVTLDVLVRDPAESTKWTNDLVSVYLDDDSGQLRVTISAPAVTNTWKYRLVAVNESTGVLQF